jgi:tetratricopeptide (TPR) repeat protein
MNESQPPVLDEVATPNRFVRFAARFSIIAPLIVILIFVFSGFLAVSGHGKITGIEMIVLGLLAMSVMLFGFISSILALVLAKRNQQKGIFGKAIVGLCLNCLLLLLLIFPAILLPHMMGNKFPTTAQGRLDKATKELAAATTDENRFYALDGAAKESFNVGKIDDAKNYATELLALAPKFQSDWNYGNAIQDGNLVLGRIAAHDGKIEEAKNYLLDAGKSPGSPQMDSFGPNMSLAKDLLEKGERDTVLQYFELCRKFWRDDYGKLDEWSDDVKAGKIPHFGANLVY